MNHTLTFDANFRLGTTLGAQAPEGYELRRREALYGDVLCLELGNFLTVVVVLQQGGVLEWARTKAYDALWDCLKAFGTKMGAAAPTGRFEVKSASGETLLNVQVPRFDPETIQSLEVAMRSDVTASSETHSLVLSIKTKP